MGCDYGGRSGRRWHHFCFSKSRTGFGACYRFAVVTIRLSSKSFWYRRVTQWLASGLGGYLAGRLREKWVGIRTDEVLFRDTAHGFLAWALATLIVVTLLTLGSLTMAAAAPATTGGSVSPEGAEAARKAAVAFAFYSSLSLLIGAFIGSVAGALGGYHRDEI